MSMHLSPQLNLPDDAVTQTFAFVARRGAGKTYGASKLGEEFLKHAAQVVILDPVGVWYGLRLAANGKEKGFEIPVFGGEHGDIPLEASGGAVVAKAIVEHEISVVLDVSHFRKNQRKQFCTDLAEELFHLKKSHRSAMHLFVEEAQVFVPQKTFHGDERMLGAFEDIIKLGRNYGIGATLISQRPQAVNKDVLNQTECLVVLQTNGAQERAALKAWMQEKNVDLSMLDELPSLQMGEAFVWSPSWLRTFKKIKIGKKVTFDASATPQVGKKTVEPKKLAPVDLKKIEEAMKETIEKAQSTDPKALQKRLRELEQQLQVKAVKGYGALQLKPAKTTKVEVPVFDKKFEDRLLKLVSKIESLGSDISAVGKNMMANLREARCLVDKAPERPIEKATYVSPVRSMDKQTTLDQVPQSNGTLPKGAHAILVALARRHPAVLTRQQISTLSGYSLKSSGFANSLSVLNTGGYIFKQIGVGAMGLSKKGLDYFGGDLPSSAQTPEELLALWRSKLPGKAADMLAILVKAKDSGLSREELANTVNISITSSGFANYLSQLNTNDLIEKRGDGRISANPLFLE